MTDYTLISHGTRPDGEVHTSRMTGTLDELIEKLEQTAKPRGVPPFSEPAGPQIETLTRKFHRKTWKWFSDAAAEQGGIVELRDYPAGAIDTIKAKPGTSMAPILVALISDKLVHQWDGEMSHTTPTPVTRAMVEAYAKLVYTHLAEEAGCTLTRVFCEVSSEATTD